MTDSIVNSEEIRVKTPHNPAPPPKKDRRIGLIIVALALLLGIAFLLRMGSTRATTAETIKSATPVAAAKLQRETLWRDVVFNGEFHPYREVDLHAKVSGYVRSIAVDIGDVVHEGDVIATLEIPEAEVEIERAVSAKKRSEEEVKRAEVARDEAHLNYMRVEAVHKSQPNLIAQQDIDTALAKDRTTESALSAAKLGVEVAQADLKKLQTMLGYARITAPFSGVVTKRYADKGALIQAGTSSSTQALPLVRLSQNDRLRLVFPVSVSYVSFVHVGKEVEIRVPSLSQAFPLQITRISGKVDNHTRSMNVEVDVPNSNSRFIPGVYASVSVKLDEKSGALALPVEALSAQKRGSVFIIINDVIEERLIKLGLETPTKVEVLSGVNEGDLILLGSRSGVKPGQKVLPTIIATDREHSL